MHIVVADIAPPIWRQIELPAVTTLTGLHGVIQVLMGWHDYHLWAFWQDKRRFEPADPEEGIKPAPRADPAELTIGDLLPSKDAMLRYNYDFGDDWWLDIKLLSSEDVQPKELYPRCLAGARAGPPEDCGGPPGFLDLMAARKNPRSKQAKERLAWAGPDWNPEKFDLTLTNKTLAALPAPRRLH
ncbi:MAG: plasmid pRiA4b ORF-3 family protein [Burkholderiales bacterium]|nr:plasmid pRiA4b ORF-3 family protein [Burkholderiales bacterium]